MTVRFHAWCDESIRLQSLKFTLAFQLDKQISRGKANCAWAELVCQEADKLYREAHHLRYRARMLRRAHRALHT